MPWNGDGVPSLALAIEDTSPASPLLSGAWSKLGKSWGKSLGFFPQMGLEVFWQNIYIFVWGIDLFSLFHFGIGIFKPKVSGFH